MIKTTKQHTKYWENRKINWEQDYLSTWNHPHRGMITQVLKSVQWHSLWEVGVGAGANLMRIVKEIPGKQLGGCDISEDAIETARRIFKGGMFHVESGDNMLMSDESVDIVLSDMCLIYVDPLKIDKYIREFYRIARNNVVLVEFHHESWWKRQLARLGGYHVYNYKTLLAKQGFYDIIVYRIPQEMWPGTDNNTEFRSLIVAKKPKTI